MAGKWAYLKGQLPTLPADPSYGQALMAQIDTYRELPLAEIAAAYNDLDEELEEREQELKDLKLRREAAERAMDQKMDAAGLESVTAAGYRWTPKIEPYPQVKDKSALRVWIDEHMRDNLSLPFQTLKATVKAALEAGDELPPGVEVFLKRSFTRTKQG